MLHQHRMLKMHIEGKDVDTAYDMDKVINYFEEIKNHLVYSGLSIPIKTYEFGAADVISKQFEFA